MRSTARSAAAIIAGRMILFRPPQMITIPNQ
jgi:hypothetical protein